MKKVLKFFAYFAFFILALMAFIPKESAYYFLEKELKNFDVVISKETLHSSIPSLRIENLNITTKGIDSAKVQSVDVTLLGLYNSLTCEDISLSTLVESYLPSKIEKLHISYSIFDPLHLNARGHGDFGSFDANVHLIDRNATVSLKPSKLMLKRYRNSLRFFKKSKNGEYTYAASL